MNVSGSPDPFETVATEAARAGFNLCGVVSIDDFDAAAPTEHRIQTVLGDRSSRSIIILGSGGPVFWEIFKGRQPGARPDDLAEANGSIDAYSRPVIKRLTHQLHECGVSAHAIHPFEGPGRQLSFRRLAERAGFGTAYTVLGVVIHPEYGPWVSVRGAIVTDAVLSPSATFDDFDSCNGCHRPCATACPVHSFDGSSWDVRACLSYRVLEAGCPTACFSRVACPVGAAQRYADEEYAYRHVFEPERHEQIRRELTSSEV